MVECTLEEIGLFKQIAGKYRKGIEAKQYFYNDVLEKIQWSEKGLPEATFAVPLWRIHDCLDWLIKEGYNKILNFMYFPKDRWVFTAESFMVETPYKKVKGEGKTRLAACLKAIWAVLEEKGNVK